MKEISKLRFNSLAGYVRDPYSFLLSEELEWYQAGNERLLGIVARDRTDDDFAYIILGRDRLKRFRAINVGHSFPTRKKARQALRVDLAKSLKQRTDSYHQGDEKGEPVDFFRPVVKPEKLNRAFRELSTRGVHPASKLIEEMMHWYEDVDGNFVQQFQSTAFDARLWELYLYALFIELGYAFDRSFQAPDFFCFGPFGKFFVEATTVNPSNPPVNLADMMRDEYYRQYVPTKFGSALYSKLNKTNSKGEKYWEQKHVKGHPFVIAIQDFHEFQSMSWSIYALTEYLFGARNVDRLKDDGTYESFTERIQEYRIGEKVIPAGFFFQPETENISAVIANPGGTIAKFDRMAALAGFGKFTASIRHGLCFRDSDYLEPFTVDVSSPDYSETWVEGLTVFHNPRAVHPLPQEYLPGAAHLYFRDGQIWSFMPPFHPIGSTTINLVTTEDFADAKARAISFEELERKLNPKFKSLE